MPYLARAWRALHEGHISDAESLAEEAFRVFTDTGHRSAFAFYAGQLLAIRRDQGRLEELLPLVAQVALENPSIAAFETALCLIHADLGHSDEALTGLQRLASDGFAAIPYDFVWLQAMCNCAEVSSWLGDHATAATLLDRLSPFHDQFASTVYSTGSVAHFVGALAATLGRFDEADRYLAEAASIETEVGAVTCLARTRLDWARMLLARATADDADRARLLLADAVSTAQTVGLPTVERRAHELIRR